ncbi:MAG TPA: PucR family transcriptional regulator ligand-binding domain-containing protein [Blastocatellia bacterium]|nr:PucR family transcriptional regulator ligand-binding domain-containing protein [Blastocatellia bacterium]
MSLTVREALSLHVLKDATLVAGHRGLDNPIRWTHIIDYPDVADWVKGGEVLITTGRGIQDDTQAQVKYMTEAVQKKVAAVFITKQEYLPHTTPEMRTIADQHDLPLVELLPTTAFVEVTEAILRRLAVRSLDAERDYLIDALLAGNLPVSAESTARLGELGLDSERPHALMLVQCTGYPVDQQLSEDENRHLMSALNHAPRRAVLIVRPSWVIAIFPLGLREDSSVPFAHSLDRLLAETELARIRIGVGRLARRLSDFPISYREAREALFIASISGDTRPVSHFNDLGVWRLLLRVEDQTELERLAHYYLSALTNHDRDQQTSWLRTLETFLDQNGNLRATARALELHRNTVTYQVENIGKLLGQDLNNPEVRLNLQLALRARRLLHARNTSSK